MHFPCDLKIGETLGTLDLAQVQQGVHTLSQYLIHTFLLLPTVELLLSLLHIRKPLSNQKQNLLLLMLLTENISVIPVIFRYGKFHLPVTHMRPADNIVILCVQIEYKLRLRRQISVNFFSILLRYIHHIANLGKHRIVEF